VAYLADKKVKFGLRNVHYAMYDATTSTFLTPIPIPGAVSLSLSANLNDYTLYADDIAFFQYRKDNGDTGDLTVTNFENGFLVDALDWTIDINGSLVETAGTLQQQFALLFETQGAVNNKPVKIRTAFYNVNGAKPNKSYSTLEDGVTAQTETMAITCKPFEIEDFGDVVLSSLANLTTAGTPISGAALTAFDNWFTTVYIPTPQP
jgi:phi13 family phage major tail protein